MIPKCKYRKVTELGQDYLSICTQWMNKNLIVSVEQKRAGQNCVWSTEHNLSKVSTYFNEIDCWVIDFPYVNQHNSISDVAPVAILL